MYTGLEALCRKSRYPVTYILKVDFLDVRNPQKIQIFRRKNVSERENYQLFNVLEKILLIDTLSLCSTELNKHTS